MLRKLGKRTDQRMAMLKNQVTALLWNGKIETTVTRGKDVARIAEKLLTLAINSFEDTVEVKKTKVNLKNEKTEITFTNDGVKKLAARRKLMAELYDVKELKAKDESKSKYIKRTRDIKHPLIEKLFNEYAPKYAARNKEQSQAGGYTTMLRLGVRRGDNAEMAIIQLI
ncbi:MAG: 50S ribosomal protein L17 [Clostridia bacterium]|nr:50S ribosomal protein L17 [Clostridia bacterium]